MVAGLYCSVLYSGCQVSSYLCSSPLSVLSPGIYTLHWGMSHQSLYSTSMRPFAAGISDQGFDLQWRQRFKTDITDADRTLG